MTVYRNENEEKDFLRILIIGIVITSLLICVIAKWGYEIVNFKI
jgi:hypothetical protein